VREIDALSEEGPRSLPGVAAELDSRDGLAIITEGLLGYLPREAVADIWRRVARVLAGFASGRYVSDVHLRTVQNLQVRGFRLLLSAFVRGRVHVHFNDAAEAEEALRSAGFRSVGIHRAVELVGDARDPGTRLAHILEASTT
jgi:O-methyltransferase involved in polyketide biosynthesis